MYSFEPTDDQNTLVDAIRKFAARELRPRMRESDELCALHSGVLRAGWEELNLLQGSIPERYGGFGEHSAITGVLVNEELAFGDVSAALALLSPNLPALAVLTAGTEEQKGALLPRFCSGSFPLGSCALMEPRYDFDPCILATSAERSSSGYVINGIKCQVPFAAESELILVCAEYEGASQAFVLPRETEGLLAGEREQNMGLRALPMHRVEFKACKVPPAGRLGGEEGCDFARLLDSFRVGQSALALGVARAAYEYALDYAQKRTAFGEAIAQRQSIAFMLAEMATDLEAARLLVWEAAWLLDQGMETARAAALARAFTDDMTLMVCDRAVQILGGHGYIRDHPVELWLRNARGFAVMEGLTMV